MSQAVIYWFLDGLVKNLGRPSPTELKYLCCLLRQTTMVIWPELARVGARPHPAWQKAFTSQPRVNFGVKTLLQRAGMELVMLPGQQKALAKNQLGQLCDLIASGNCPEYVVLCGLDRDLPLSLARIRAQKFLWVASLGNTPAQIRNKADRVVVLSEPETAGKVLRETLFLWDVENFIPVKSDMPGTALDDLRAIADGVITWLQRTVGYGLSRWSLVTVRKNAPYREDLQLGLLEYGLSLRCPGSVRDPAEEKLFRHVRKLVSSGWSHLSGHATLLSGDSDVGATIELLQHNRCQVMGVSWRGQASRALQQQCDTFVFLEDILGKEKVGRIGTRPDNVCRST